MEKLISFIKFDWLQGYRTYVIGAVVVLAVLAEKFGGIDIPGFTVDEDWLGMIMVALGLGAARAKYTDPA